MFAAVLLLAAQSVPSPGETRAQAEAAARSLHARLDADHDGYVTYAEVMASAARLVIPAGAPPPPIDSPTARAAFAEADRDGDGRISLAEAVEGADRTFDEADTNHDGVLSPDERGAYAARQLGRVEAELKARPPLPCRPAAACARAK